MQQKIFDYLETYGSASFKELPFSEVDALCVAQFSYLKWENMIPKIIDNEENISIQELYLRMDKKEVLSDEIFAKDNQRLLDEMVYSIRFGNMSFNYLSNILNEDVETQFFAFTCFLEDAIPIVVFRGTDETIVGWKEDFNMAFTRPVIGQNLSALYLNQVGLRITGKFNICGHSKGGNFAVYSAMNTLKDIQNRIEKIYSFDGPGFRPELLEEMNYKSIEDRVEKWIPSSSLIGMIMEHHEPYRVVESSSVGVLQHNPYTWILDGIHFKCIDDIDKGTRMIYDSMNEWILSLNEKQLNTFIDTLFGVFAEADIKYTFDFLIDWKKNALPILDAMKNVDSESKDMIHGIIQQFFEVLASKFKKKDK